MRKIPYPTVLLLLEDKNFSERKSNYMKVVKTIIVKNWKNFVLVLVILIGAITDMKIMVKMDGDTFCEFIRFCYVRKQWIMWIYQDVVNILNTIICKKGEERNIEEMVHLILVLIKDIADEISQYCPLIYKIMQFVLICGRIH